MQQLADLLANETSCLKKLFDILKREQEALLATDADTIEQIAAEKQKALHTQSTTTQSRLHFTEQRTNDSTKAGLQQLIDQSENTAELKAALAEISSLAQQCQDQNRTNGRLINQKQQQTQGALNILRQADSSPGTYSGHGDTPPHQQSRSLGKA